MSQTLDITTNSTTPTKWQPYAEYKASGVEWLGEIPEHWEVKRLKHTVHSCQNGIWGEEPKDDVTDIVCIRVADFDRTTNRINDRNLTIRSVSIDQRRDRTLKRGNLLLEKSGGGELQPVGTVVLYNLDISAVCSNFVAVMSVADNYDASFLCYIHSNLYAARLNTQYIKQNTGIQNLDADAYLNERVGFPELLEQRAIAAFLDRETASIHALLAKKQQLIDLLRERRTALISHTVTKGLDPTVPMKDSGVAWLGEIPSHWTVKKLKFVGNFFGGGTPFKGNPEYWTGDIPWVSPKDMKAEIICDAEDHITEIALQDSSTRLVPPGTVLIVVRSGILRHTIPVAINNTSVALNQDMKAIVPKRFMKAEYLAALIRGHQVALLNEWRKEGATVESVEHELLVNTFCSVPPFSEQQEIVAYLNKETARIDALIARIEQGKKKLEEYSTALISAAVTGKIDVRGL